MTTLRQIRPIHPFPARMAPSVAWNALKETEGGQLRVLDPFAGSGTSLVIARAYGHESVGFDLDPMAVLLAQTWTADVDPVAVRQAARHVLKHAQGTWRKIKASAAYPLRAGDSEREFVRYWFDLSNRKQLHALSCAISRVRRAGVQRILWCAFSRMIIAKQAGVSLAMDVPHSRPHRKFDVAPKRALDLFDRSVEYVLDRVLFSVGEREFPASQVSQGDARCVPLADESVDVVITSPPYLNAIDYLRGHRLALVWMGHALLGLREIRAKSVGSEVGGPARGGAVMRPEAQSAMRACGPIDDLPARWQRVLSRYVGDMDAVVGEVGRVLKRGGRAIFVMGDSSIRGVFVRNSSALIKLAKIHGLRVTSRRSRPLPENRRYLPPPRTGGDQLGSRMRREVIVSLIRD